MKKVLSQIFKDNLINELIFILIVAFAGINFQLNWFSLQIEEAGKSISELLTADIWAKYNMNIRILAGGILLTLIIYTYRFIIYYFLMKNPLLKQNLHHYFTKELWIFLPLLLTGMGYLGFKINFFLIITLILVIQMYILFNFYATYSNLSMNENKIPNHRLYMLFFLSGFAALIYQVVWQRVLFKFFGVNIETVTVIVSIFLLGLGIGALIGGLLSKKYPKYLPHLFSACEAIIGIFGLFSLSLFELIYHSTLHSSPLLILIIIYAILLIPTICMGATLPILVEYFHKTIKKVGSTVSFLYFINTIGSALASFFTVKVLFIYTSMSFAVLFASICNLLVSAFGLKFIFNNNPKLDTNEEDKKPLLNVNGLFIFMLFISFLTGYIAMSQEILWIRLVGYMTGGKAEVFGMLVGAVLVGIALGSLIASWLCKRLSDKKIIFALAWIILSATILYFISIPIFGQLAVKIHSLKTSTVIYLVAGLISLLMGINFPVITHFAIKSGFGVGKQVSWIYFANILGSTLGPIITGFILLDILSFEKNTLFLTILSFALALTLYIFSIEKFSIKKIYQPVIFIGTIILLLNFNKLYHHLFEKIQYQEWYWGQPLKHIIQNRHGIISVIEEKEGDDVVIGGGLYDGRINYTLSHNRNMIDRAYAVLALKPDADTILEIGLSSGSWTNVLAFNKNLKLLDVVEINPGYIQLIKQYPSHIGILNNPKVNIHIDDGRRWLSRTDKKFDFILMNTTYHWRSQINNLVSKEFLELCKQHLLPGGVMYYNTTGSDDIVYTAAHVFNFITRYSNFVACSDHPFPEDFQEKLNALKNFYIEGQQVYQSDTISMQTMEQIANSQFHVNLKNDILKQTDRYLITDNNLASEFKTPTKFYNKNLKWSLLLKDFVFKSKG